jgi:hypothetical protein
MVKMYVRFGFMAIVFWVSGIRISLGQNAHDVPVTIAFDRHSERIDILSGKKLPDYTAAQREDFQFFEGRLDSPTDHISYMFSTVTTIKTADLARMRKIHAQDIWGLTSSSDKNTVLVANLVKAYAVSFIPINPVTQKPEPRVCVLLEDMYLIQWAPIGPLEKISVSTKNQSEYESAEGTVY